MIIITHSSSPPFVCGLRRPRGKSRWSLQQLVVSAGGGDAAVVHHDDQVGVLHGGDALRDDDLGGLGDIGSEARADERVGAGIDGGGRVVEDQHLRLLEQRARDAQALLLAAGDVRAALLDVGVVAVGEGADKVVRLRELAGRDELLVRRVLDCPSGGFP